MLNSILISDVSFCTTWGSKKEILAFISKDTRLKRVTCHIYECLNAHKITTAIGESFQQALKDQQDRASNPFAAETTDREGELASQNTPRTGGMRDGMPGTCGQREAGGGCILYICPTQYKQVESLNARGARWFSAPHVHVCVS